MGKQDCSNYGSFTTSINENAVTLWQNTSTRVACSLLLCEFVRSKETLRLIFQTNRAEMDWTVKKKRTSHHSLWKSALTNSREIILNTESSFATFAALKCLHNKDKNIFSFHWGNNFQSQCFFFQQMDGMTLYGGSI